MIQKITAGIAATAILAALSTTMAFADTGVNVSGNGANAVSNVTVHNYNSSSVSQTNVSDVFTSISQSGNTGGNTSSFNTGADTSIITGDASSTAIVGVTGNTNTAALPNSCGCTGNTGINISGNGANAITNVWVKNKNKQNISQVNDSSVTTLVSQINKTGKNNSSFNTNGSTGIVTGNATSGATVLVNTGSNTITP